MPLRFGKTFKLSGAGLPPPGSLYAPAPPARGLGFSVGVGGRAWVKGKAKGKRAKNKAVGKTQRLKDYCVLVVFCNRSHQHFGQGVKQGFK